MIDKFSYQEMTFILRMPLWWTYAGGMLGAVGIVIVAAYCVVRSLTQRDLAQPHKPEPGMVE